MSAKAENIGTAVNSANAVWLFPETHAGLPFDGPGMVATTDRGSTQFVAVKHPKYRPYQEQAPGTFSGDCISLTTAIQDEPYAMGSDRLQGVEAELNIVDPEGEPFDLYPNGQPLPAAGLEDHPELLRNTFETDGAPSSTSAGAYDNVMRSVRDISKDLEAFDGWIDPASARMQDAPTAEDITPNPYVNVMVKILGDRVLKFIGVGIHEHHDLHVGYGPLVAGYLRLLAPYLNLGLQAAPFGFGEQTPRLGEILGSDEIAQYDGKQPQSVRYPTRFAASPNGGVGLMLAHDNLSAALFHADQQLTAGEVSNPARHYGSHADVRVRYDAPSETKLDHPGRIELCVKDTAALRAETLQAYGELSRAVLLQLERAAAEGEGGLTRLHQDFPGLFGTNYDTTALATKQLPRTHQNALSIAYNGADAILIDGVGKKTTARDQFRDLVRFATRDNMPLPVTVVKTLKSSLAPTRMVEAKALAFKDDQGLPSLAGYYETGTGTAAQWMIVRSVAATALGMTPEDNMRSGTQDRTSAFKQYLTLTAPTTK